MHPVARSRYAFTLVELLVVIGIIAVLVALLLPALNRTRQYSRAVACSSQMRQIGLAMLQYAHDNDDTLPMCSWEIDTPYTVYTWDKSLAPYWGIKLADADFHVNFLTRPIPIVQCPDDQLKRVWAATNYPRSYAPVRVLLGANDARGYGFAGVMGQVHTSVPALAGKWTAKLVHCPRPAEVLMLVEKPSTWNAVGDSVSTFADRPAHQSPYGKCQYPIANQSSYGNPDITSHGTKWNYLFVDGHVSFLHWRETLGGNPLSTLSMPKGPWTRYSND